MMIDTTKSTTSISGNKSTFAKEQIANTWYGAMASENENITTLTAKYNIIFYAKAELEQWLLTSHITKVEKDLYKTEIEKCDNLLDNYHYECNKKIWDFKIENDECYVALRKDIVRTLQSALWCITLPNTKDLQL